MKIQILSQGGLGNQLFQARYAHYLAEIHPGIKVEFVNHNINKDRDFVLDGFFIECSHVIELSTFKTKTDLIVRIARSLDRRSVALSNFYRRIFGILEAKDAYEGIGINVENSILDSLGFRKKRVIGHFQNSAFVLPNDCFNSNLLSFVYKKTSRTSITEDSVCHFRQGDYYKNRSMGPLAETYFHDIVQSLKNRSGSYLIHSDGEPNATWLPKGVKLNSSASFSDNPFDLLYDGAHANIFIGSNSSLSWWASYLQSILNVSGLSIFPNEWMRDTPTKQLPLYRKSWKLHQVYWV